MIVRERPFAFPLFANERTKEITAYAHAIAFTITKYLKFILKFTKN